MIKHSLLTTLAVLLRPLIRLLLKNGVPYGSFAEVARWVYVDVAAREFAISSHKQSISRISVITGLTRKDVARLQESALADSQDSAANYNRAARVVSGWMRECSKADNSIADLSLDGTEPSFASLVKRYSGDMPVRAVLDELIRVGTAVRLDENHLRLVTRAYLPSAGNAEQFDILGRDVADLISTIDHNLTATGAAPYFQRKVEYNNLPAECLPDIRRLLSSQGQGLLEQFDQLMSTHDRDVNPGVAGAGRKRAMVGIYYFEEDVVDCKD